MNGFIHQLSDARTRERICTDLDETFFVEAGAGTGKTSMLVSRIVALVAANKLRMERLAAITFTEAAAAELRDRIRQELEKAAVHSGQEAELCQRASREVDLAAIQTIHSFAGALLRTYPLEAQLPPNFAMLDHVQQTRNFEDRFRGWLYDEVPAEAYPERRSAVGRALALGMTAEELRELARRLQDYRDLISPDTTWPRPLLQNPVEVAQRWGRELDGLSAATAEALDPEDKLALELRRLGALAERMREVDDTEEALRLLVQVQPKQGGDQRKWPRGRCKQIKDVLKECSAELDEVVARHRAAALSDILQHLRDFTLSFADKRLHDGEATFHDLLTWARDLLRDHPEVRARAQGRFDRLFVDEFQDTDPLQVEIAWFLASDESQVNERDWTRLRLKPGKLFIVGDPKQSIYRFRRADIRIYHQVYAQLERQGERLVLSQSFRSPEPLVEWFNHHFQDDIQEQAGVQPAYARLEPHPREGDFAVRHFGTRIDVAGDRWSEEATTVAELARQIVGGPQPWSVSCREGARPARYSDLCVLIPTRTNLRRLERAFSNRRVPYRMESGWLVLQTQEVRDLLSCLRAIDDPSDQVALVAALRSPAYACSDVDLLCWIDNGGRLDYERPGTGCDGPVRCALESLRVFHAARLDRTPAATVETFIRERMLAVQAVGSPQPRDALRRLRYVVARTRALASSGQATLREVCDWLEARQSELYYDAESALPESDEDAVRFLTVHGAKGLEFPIVILTGLATASSRAGPQSVDLVPDYDRNVLHIRCGDFATDGYHREEEKAMYEAEQRRLLYVAATRARDHLVLSLYRGKDACHASRILERLGVRAELSREVTLAPTDVPVAAVDELVVPADAEAAARHRTEETDWLATRDTLIGRLSNQPIVVPSHLAHLDEEPEIPDPPPEPDPNNTVRRLRRGRGGSALGRAVHAVLQTIDLASLENLDALAQSAAREEKLSLDGAESIAEYVRNAVGSNAVQRALASGRYWREVPVGIVRSDGTLLEGAIDLLYQAADGAVVVVDYKTDHITESQLADRAETYRLQGEAYAEAVRSVTSATVRSVEFVFAALGGRMISLPYQT